MALGVVWMLAMGLETMGGRRREGRERKEPENTLNIGHQTDIL
jgi:hypothetical protein